VAAPIATEILQKYFELKARDEATGAQSLLDQLEAIAP